MQQEDSAAVATRASLGEPDLGEVENLRMSILEYWQDQYHRETSPIESSPFAAEILASLDSPSLVVDLGCGNGRDSLYFAEARHNVVAVDGSSQAIEHLRNRVPPHLESRLSSLVADLADPSAYDQVQEVVQGQRKTDTKLIVYARFLLHAVPRSCQDLLVERMTALLRRGDEMHLEYRTGDLDVVTYAFGSSHYRRSVDPESVEAVARRVGVTAVNSEVSDGFAPLGRERPLCARTHLLR